MLCLVRVAFKQNQWDKKQFIHDFEEDWGIVLTDDDTTGTYLSECSAA